MNRKLPDGASTEVADAEKFQITDTGRTYREVNQSNRGNDGMAKLHREDYGFRSMPGKKPK